MKKIFFLIAMSLMSRSVTAAETIVINSPYSSGHGGHASTTPERRQEIGTILDQATLVVGKDEIRRMSDFVSPMFAKQITAQQFYNARVAAIKKLRAKYRSELTADK